MFANKDKEREPRSWWILNDCCYVRDKVNAEPITNLNRPDVGLLSDGTSIRPRRTSSNTQGRITTISRPGPVLRRSLTEDSSLHTRTSREGWGDGAMSARLHDDSSPQLTRPTTGPQSARASFADYPVLVRGRSMYEMNQLSEAVRQLSPESEGG